MCVGGCGGGERLILLILTFLSETSPINDFLDIFVVLLETWEINLSNMYHRSENEQFEKQIVHFYIHAILGTLLAILTI